MTDVSDILPPEDKERQESFKDQFLSFTPNEVEAWIQDNVNDLATAKLVLARLGKVVNALAHKVTGE